MKPKYKKGDIVKHILSQEKLLILKVRKSWMCGCNAHSGAGCLKKNPPPPAFNGYYTVLLTNYEEKAFPEDQLVPLRN